MENLKTICKSPRWDKKSEINVTQLITTLGIKTLLKISSSSFKVWSQCLRQNNRFNRPTHITFLILVHLAACPYLRKTAI